MASLTREEGNRFVEALNKRSLCACAVLRQLLQLRVPGPYLECERHKNVLVDDDCIHPGVFAMFDEPTTHCYTCGRDIPREEL
jgi:hypothetical protein